MAESWSIITAFKFWIILCELWLTFEHLCKLWVKWLPNKIRGWKTLLICAGLRLLSGRTIWPCTYCLACSDNSLSTASGKIGREGRGERFIRAADALIATHSSGAFCGPISLLPMPIIGHSKIICNLGRLLGLFYWFFVQEIRISLD